MKHLLVLIAAGFCVLMTKSQSVDTPTARAPLTEKKQISETEEIKRKAEAERQLILRKAAMERQAAIVREIESRLFTINTNQLGKFLEELRKTKANEKLGDFWLPGEFEKERKRKAQERTFEGSPSRK